MSLTEFEDFVFHACLLDDARRIQLRAGRQSRWRAAESRNWLSKSKRHVEVPGTDLTMSIEGRGNCELANGNGLPSGEVLSPVRRYG